MLVLPVRRSQHLDHDTFPHTSPPALQMSDTCTTRHAESADSMTSAIPTTMPLAQGPRKPRLTLNTANVPLLPMGAKSRTALCMSAVTESPTYRNTHANAFEAASLRVNPRPSDGGSSPQSTVKEPSSSPRSASTITSTISSASDSTSPFSAGIPYSLPVGSHSILRNSPLPKRHAVGSRPPRVYFPAVKKVGFQDSNLVQYIPFALRREDFTSDSSSDTSDAETSPKRKHDPTSDDYDEIVERRELDQLLEDRQARSSPVHGRRKRRREWIWRPLDNDILERHHSTHSSMAQEECTPSARPAEDDLTDHAIPSPVAEIHGTHPGDPAVADTNPDENRRIDESPPLLLCFPTTHDEPPSAPVSEKPPIFLPAATYDPAPSQDRSRLAAIHPCIVGACGETRHTVELS